MTIHISPSDQHKHFAKDKGPVCVAMITVSDTRNEQTDINGQYLQQELTALKHSVVFNVIIKDDSDQILQALKNAIEKKAKVVIFNGGTGVSKRDCTYDIIASLLEKTLTGFGELFRMLSYQQVGSAAMFSRAVAGVYKETAIICLPGSPKAVQLAWEKLIKEEISHLAWEITK